MNRIYDRTYSAFELKCMKKYHGGAAAVNRLLEVLDAAAVLTFEFVPRGSKPGLRRVSGPFFMRCISPSPRGIVTMTQLLVEDEDLKRANDRFVDLLLSPRKQRKFLQNKGLEKECIATSEFFHTTPRLNASNDLIRLVFT